MVCSHLLHLLIYFLPIRKLFIILHDKLHYMIDEIEKIILGSLGKNARISSIEITRLLHALEYSITERAVRYRIKKLEKDGIIIGYSTILNPNYTNEKIQKLILIKF